MATDDAVSPDAAVTTSGQDVLRIQVSTIAPFQTVIWGPNGTFSCEGVGPRIYAWIANYLNLTYVLVPVTDGKIKEVGLYNASVNLLVAGDVDMMTTPNLEMSPIHSNYMDFSHPYLYQEIKLLLPVPEEDTSAWQILAPFSPMVWLGVVAVLFIIPIMMKIFVKLIARMIDEEELNHENSFVSNFLHAFAIFTNHELGNNWINRQTAHRTSLLILVGFWLLAMTVAVNSYAGVFASILTVPKLKPTIDTLEDLAADRDLLIGARESTVITDRMMAATSGVYKELGDKLRANSSGIFRSERQKNQLIASKKYAVMLTEVVANYAMGMDYMQTKSCHYTTSPSIYSTYLCFGLAKKGKYNQDINRALMALWETGLVNKWSAESIPRYRQCLIKKHPTAVKRPIKLTDLASAFYVLMIGIGVSAFVFSIELLIKLQKTPTSD